MVINLVFDPIESFFSVVNPMFNRGTWGVKQKNMWISGMIQSVFFWSTWMCLSETMLGILWIYGILPKLQF